MPTFAPWPMEGLLLSVGCVILLNVPVVVAEVEGEDFEDKDVELEASEAEVDRLEMLEIEIIFN